jgi:hypothetical protein
MGLDAVVRCRCWRDGHTTAPPVARDLISDCDGFLELTLPYGGNEGLHDDFRRWLEDACPHPGMHLASEWISGWPGYRLFQSALEHAGWEHFPLLRSHLPATNHGELPAADAPAALAELRFFTGTADLGTITELLDDATGEPINRHVAAYAGVFVFSRDWELGVDERGFFVRDVRRDPPREVFRAMRFTQRIAGPAPGGDDGAVRFADMDSAAEVTVGCGPVTAGAAPADHSRSLRVRTRPATGQDFGSVVDALTTVVEAAIASGNPVHWC